MDLSNEQTIKAILKAENLYAKKFLGQNFLVNKESLELILETANINESDEIIEVGPGLGVLTIELIKKAQHITSIELDPQLANRLKSTFEKEKKLTIIQQDALKFIPPKKQYKVVANIPYNITSPLLNHFLQADNKPLSLTLLVQKEVAEKICTCEPDMTILSLQVNIFGTPKYIATVPSEHFHPSPKVDSAIIHIQTHTPSSKNYMEKDEALKILKKAKIAFSQRRKKILNTLNLRSHLTELEKIQIDPNRRPETLSIEEWQSLLKILK